MKTPQPIELTSSQITAFRETIWAHFREHGRVFPWRKTADPYAIMVSEFMLQQTQTVRVVEKYEAWLLRFPTVQSVAGAELSEVLSLWNGLGYNRRAKFLHDALPICRTICAEHGGCVPSDAETLDALPGIGAYTARAIAAFAFNKAEAFIETNIRSVFIHFFFEADEVSDSDILPLVEATLDRSNPRLWYYALMDYGADLKKRGENPSRKSKSYAKQSAFAGSLRQARGAILRQLTKIGNGGAGLTLEEIAESEQIDLARLATAAEKLVEEGMIRDAGGRFVFG